MRNLKRALSLTLASVMLLGMMVVGTSAASFPDVTAEDNVEAIEVLAAVKVLQGYDDGQYHAENPVTRNQMATIICRMMGWRSGDYAGLNSFPDVPDWAANYVAACVTNGIVNGRDDGRFHGDDTVTATEAASMMLRALGYTRMPVGAAWAQAVAQQSARINLFNELDVGAYTAMTRGDVSQLALNTLESAMVEVDDNTLHIDAGNGVTVSGGQVNYVVVTSSKPYATAISDAESSGNALNGVNGPIVELGEHVFNGDLKKEDSTDNFGRPSTTWKYKTSEVGVYAETAQTTFVGKVSRDALYSAIGRSVINGLDNGGNTVANTSSFADGDVGDTPKMIVYYDGKAQAAAAYDTYVKRNDNTAAGMSGKSVVTEVYVDEYYNVVVSQYATYLMQATNDYSASKDTLSVTMLTKPTGASNVSILEGEDFPVSGYQNDDYILYTYSLDANEVQTIAKANVVTGKVDSYSNKTASFGSAGGWVKLDGQQYDFAKYAAVDSTNGCGVTFGVDEEAAIVLDANDCILWVDDSSIASGNYVYIDGMLASGLGTTLEANAYFADGTKKEIVIDKIRDSSRKNITSVVKGNVTSVQDLYDGWYSYGVSDDNKYTLTAASTNALVQYTTANTTATKVINNGKVSFLSAYDANATDTSSTEVGTRNTGLSGAGANNIVAAGAVTIRGNANTIFIVKDKDGDLKAYNGIGAVPSIKTGAANSDTLTVTYIKTSDKASSTYASLVYIDAEKNSGIDDSNNAYDVMYVLDQDTWFTDKNNTIEVWNAVVNGEQKKVEAKAGELSAYTMYYKVKADNNNYLTATDYPTIANPDGAYKRGTLAGGVSADGFSLVAGSSEFIWNEDTQITLIVRAPEMQQDNTNDNKKYEITEGISADSLDRTLDDWTVQGSCYAVTTTSTGDTLKTLYVVVDSVDGGKPGQLPDQAAGSWIKDLQDGAYTPGDSFDGNGDMVGDGEDNVMFKFTIQNTGKYYQLVIKGTGTDSAKTFYTSGTAAGTAGWTDWSTAPVGASPYYYIYKWGVDAAAGNAAPEGAWDVTNNKLVAGTTYSYTIYQANDNTGAGAASILTGTFVA